MFVGAKDGRLVELVGDQHQVLKHFSGAREGEGDEGAKEMLGEERLPKEQWRKVGMSGLLRERRSEEMTRSNTSFLRGSEVPFES